MVKNELAQYIESNGVKQNWIAEKAGVAASTIGNIVNGHYRPSADLAAKLEELTGIDARVLLGIPKQESTTFQETSSSEAETDRPCNSGQSRMVGHHRVA